MPFFAPFMAQLGPHPAICYTDIDMAKKFGDNFSQGQVRYTLEDFGRRAEPLPEDTDFCIAFVWTDGGGFYVDLWVQRQYESYGPAGPMVTLASYELASTMPIDIWRQGNGCNWTRIVSGREAEWFDQTVGKDGWSIAQYLSHPRPEMPEGFIIPWQLANKEEKKAGYGLLADL